MSGILIDGVARSQRHHVVSSGNPVVLSPSQLSLAERAVRIEMLLLDVDGVLTDGRISYGDAGGEVKAFHVRDGLGLKLWGKAGKRAGIITGRSCQAVAVRAAELNLEPVIQGAAEKEVAFRGVLQRHRLRAEQVCFVGDDLPDLPVLGQCGLAVAVADASPEVLARAHYVTRFPGGHGAVRETIELILRAQGQWQKIVAGFLVGETAAA